jgi:hypothetical protein
MLMNVLKFCNDTRLCNIFYLNKLVSQYTSRKCPGMVIWQITMRSLCQYWFTCLVIHY